VAVTSIELTTTWLFKNSGEMTFKSKPFLILNIVIMKEYRKLNCSFWCSFFVYNKNLNSQGVGI